MTTRTELAQRAGALGAARAPFVWATVVRAERPTSTKPGDAALVLPDGRIEGFVGGACAETTVRVQALEALAHGEARLVHIVPPAGSGAAPEGADAGPDSPRSGEVTVANPCLSGGSLDIFLQPELPAPLVVVLGEGPIARALERAGVASGHQVRLAGDAEGELPCDTTAVVLASHGRNEEAAISAALAAGVPYIGLVASRRRGAAVVESLGLSEHERARVHTPAGLDIGARTPGEVALSILAEIVSLRPARPGGPAFSPGQIPDESLRAGTSTPAGAAAVPGTAVDPVCGMTVATVESSLSAEVGGRRVWFCGPGCREAYLDRPGRYDT